jgi:hypothetical protein
VREERKERIRTAWRGPLTAAEIADAHKTSESKVRRIWKDAKAAGLLPAEPTPRPHFVERCKPVVIDDEAPIDVSDESPIFDPNPRFVAQCDALLAALREHHADCDFAAAHHYATDRYAMPLAYRT